MTEKMICVTISYEDGYYYMHEGDPTNEWVKENCIEVPESDYIQYQHFREEVREWNEYLLRLSNEVYERKEKANDKTVF